MLQKIITFIFDFGEYAFKIQLEDISDIHPGAWFSKALFIRMFLWFSLRIKLVYAAAPSVTVTIGLPFFITEFHIMGRNSFHQMEWCKIISKIEEANKKEKKTN